MLKASDIMTRDVVVVAPDLPVAELAVILCEKRISGVPVVDKSGKLLSVVTENDLIDQAKKIHIPTALAILDAFIFIESPGKFSNDIKKMTGTTVQDICAAKLVTITEDTPLDEIATIMAEKKVHTLPVVADGSVVGVVGKSDIIKTLAGS